MKKKLSILLVSFVTILSTAQTTATYQLKAEYINGAILKHTQHLENLVNGPTQGGELSIEWKTMGEKPWHQYYNFPSVGIGLVGLDLGNTKMLGQLMAVYPYLNFKLINKKFFKLNLKAGAGASYLNTTFEDAKVFRADGITVNLDSSNAAIGSHLNVYFACGGNMEIPLFSGISLVAAYNWNHASNGSFIQPNSGLNMLNASVGLSYFPTFKTYVAPIKKDITSLPQKFSMDVVIAGGARELYYLDNKMYPIGSVAVGVYRQVGNNFRIGLGVDGFYDGVYGAVNASSTTSENTTKYKLTYIASDKIENKIRVGISLRPELIIGKLSAGIHFGMYLYNPVKNLEPYSQAKTSTLNKPLIYSYDIEKESGWLYTRVSMKYAISKHYFISLGLKTHQQKAEFIEWGMGVKW